MKPKVNAMAPAEAAAREVVTRPQEFVDSITKLSLNDQFGVASRTHEYEIFVTYAVLESEEKYKATVFETDSTNAKDSVRRHVEYIAQNGCWCEETKGDVFIPAHAIKLVEVNFLREVITPPKKVAKKD